MDRSAVVSPDVIEEGHHAVDEGHGTTDDGHGAIDKGCNNIGEGCNNVDVDCGTDNDDSVLGGIISSPLVAFPWLEVS